MRVDASDGVVRLVREEGVSRGVEPGERDADVGGEGGCEGNFWEVILLVTASAEIGKSAYGVLARC